MSEVLLCNPSFSLQIVQNQYSININQIAAASAEKPLNGGSENSLCDYNGLFKYGDTTRTEGKDIEAKGIH